MTEIWKDIPGFEGKYQASNLGQIRSLDMELTVKNRWGGFMTYTKPGRILSCASDHTGYNQVSLGREYKSKVHSVVALTFLGPRGANVVNHKNSDKSDNKLENLEYISSAQNAQHAVTAGKWVKYKLTSEQVLEIRNLRNNGRTLKSIGDQFNVTSATVYKIVNFHTYKKTL